MRRVWRRLLSGVLAAVMALTMLPATACAAVSDLVRRSAVENAALLQALQEVYGDDAESYLAVLRQYGLVDGDGNIVTDEKIEMTDWELHDFAVQVVRKNLVESGEQVTASNSNPELQPSIWMGGDTGLQWVVVQAVRYPQEAKIPDNIHEIEAAYKAKGARGNFAYVSFANENQQRDTPLKEGEKPLPIYRGEKHSSAIQVCSTSMSDR